MIRRLLRRLDDVASVRQAVLAAALAASLTASARAAENKPAPDPKPVDAKAADAKGQAAPRPPLAPLGRVRALEGDEYSRAVDARNQADLLRSGHERRYHSGKSYPKNDPTCDADFAAVVAAYRGASAVCPDTAIDCYCRLRLAGAYQYRGDFGRAVDEAKQAAERFANTPLAAEAQMSVGLIYLGALHQPRQAEPWFQRAQAAATRREPRDPQDLRKSPQERDARDASEAAADEKWLTAASEALAQCRQEIRAQEAQGKQGPNAAAGKAEKGDNGKDGQAGGPGR